MTQLEVHHHHHFDPELYQVLYKIVKGNNLIMATLQDVANAVNAETSVDNSIVSLLNGIVQQLKDAQASQDPAALDAVVANIQANTKILSDAITANTPAQSTAGQTSSSSTTTPAPTVTSVA